MFEKTKQKFDRLLARDDITVLGLESSCDETAAAVTRGRRVLSSSIISQADIHKRFGGVVPEVASRNHTVNFTAVIEDALESAGMTLDEIDVIAVTARPGLIGPLLIGVSTAKALCFAKNIPLVAVNHIEAHICANYAVFDESGKDKTNFDKANCDKSRSSDGEKTSKDDCGASDNTDGDSIGKNDSCATFDKGDCDTNCGKNADRIDKGICGADCNDGNAAVGKNIAFRIESGLSDCGNPCDKRELKPPFLALVASGGHTSIIDVTGYNQYNLIGRTTDDAIGEAFDKVARIVGLPYPGGPNVDAHARKGEPNIEFMRSRGVQKDYTLSYSGLKTAVVNYVHKLNQRGEPINISDICASFTRQAVDMLVDTVFAAAESFGRDTIVIAGGVASNSYLRETLYARGGDKRIVMPPPKLCTDNAVMVALRGFFSAREGKDYADLSLNASSVV